MTGIRSAALTLFASAAALSAGLCLAEAPPVVPEWSAERGLSSKPPAGTGITLGSLRITLEQTKLTQVQQALGGRIAHHGDAGDSLYWLCYTLPEMKQRLWLAYDEMGAGSINHIYAAVSTQPASQSCPVPKVAIKQPPALDNGLWLGATQAQVNSTLGKPTLRHGRWQTFLQWRKQPSVHQGKKVESDLLNDVDLTMSNGRVNVLHAHQVESY